MTQICPIHRDVIDENIARLNASFTTVIVLISVYYGSLIPLLFLMADFSVRAASKPQYSFLARLSKLISRLFKIEPKKVNAGPKLFAAKIGAIFSLLLAVLLFVGATQAIQIVSILFVSCAFLEAAFGYCVGCKFYTLYHGLKSIVLKKKVSIIRH